MKETGGSMKSRSLCTHWDMYQKDAWVLSRREPVRPQGYHDALSWLFERQRDSHLVSWNNFPSWSYKEVDDEINRTKNWKPLPLLKDTARHNLGVVLRLRTCWYRMRAFHNGKAMPDWAVNPPTETPVFVRVLKGSTTKQHLHSCNQTFKSFLTLFACAIV